jgi:tRNA (cmo5U34)-methyltransferase
MFNFEQVEDFEKHINLSIPNYNGLCDILRAFVSEYANPLGKVIDIGCSAGTFLHSLQKRNDIEYVGVDIIDIRKYKDFQFVLDDAINYLKTIESADVILSMFTMQFLGKHKRKELNREIKRLVDDGCVFLNSEKVFLSSKIESVLKREHLQQKRKHFSDTEILDKDRDLFGSMYCLREEDLRSELSNIGTTTQVWQSYNFTCFVVTK